MIRPTTPIPNGCSFTLLSCQVQVAPKQPSSITRVKSQQRLLTNTSNIKQKTSLRSAKSPPYRRVTSPNLCRSSNSGISAGGVQYAMENSFSEISSVIGPKTMRNQQKYSQAHLSQINSPRQKLSQIIQKYPFKKVSIMDKSPLIKIGNNNTNPFTDEITLNHQSGSYEIKQRETSNTNNLCSKKYVGQPKNVEIYRTQRRVFTQQDNFQSNSRTFNYTKPSVHSPIVCRSEFFTPQNNFAPVLNTTEATLPLSRYPILKKSQIMQVRTQPSQQPSEQVLRQSFPSQVQNTENAQNICNSKLFMQTKATNGEPLMPINENRLSQNSPFHLMLKESVPVSHLRKESSPRFPKKFNTLIDLNCKNVESSGGEKTSSNHVSIVASGPGESLAGTNRSNRSNQDIKSVMGDFTKIIKFMTLKSMPLKQQY